MNHPERKIAMTVSHGGNIAIFRVRDLTGLDGESEAPRVEIEIRYRAELLGYINLFVDNTITAVNQETCEEINVKSIDEGLFDLGLIKCKDCASKMAQVLIETAIK